MNLKDEKNLANIKKENRFQFAGTTPAKTWKCEIIVLEEQKYVQCMEGMRRSRQVLSQIVSHSPLLYFILRAIEGHCSMLF